eukprot:g81885.t1
MSGMAMLDRFQTMMPNGRRGSIHFDHGFPPWVQIWACIAICSACATIFITPLYAQSLQGWAGLSNSSFQLWAGVLDGSAMFAMPASYLLSKLGLRVFGQLAGVFDLAGYSLLYLASSGRVSANFIWLGAVLMGQGSISSVMVSLQYVGGASAPEDRGKIIGVLMTAFGLSGGIFAACFKCMWRGMMTTRAFFFCGLLMFLVKVPASLVLTDPTSHTFRFPTTAVGAYLYEALGFLLILTFLVTLLPFASPTKVRAVATAVAVPYLLVVFLMGVFIFFSFLCYCGDVTEYDEYQDITVEEGTPLLEEIIGRPSSHKGSRAKAVQVMVPAPTTLPQALKQARFWVLWYQLAILVGGGFAFLNHLHDIVASEHGPMDVDLQLRTSHGGAHAPYMTPSHTSAHYVIGATSFFTVGNVCSRFLTGFGADFLAKVVKRSSLMNGAMLTLLASMLLLLIVDVSSETLFVPALINGFAFGSPWTLVPGIEQAWFGMQHFAKIHGVMMLACVFGAFCVNDGLSWAIEMLIPSDDPSGGMNASQFRGLWVCLSVLATVGVMGGCCTRSRQAKYQEEFSASGRTPGESESRPKAV